MVRLVITDFSSLEENNNFYNNNFAKTSKVFAYSYFKKYSVFIPKQDLNDKLYSINILSRKYLGKKEFLVYIEDEVFIIVFNHRVIFKTKMDQNYLTDDIMKSIVTIKHMAMITSHGEIEKLSYIVNSKHQEAIKQILRQNTKNASNKVIAHDLGDIRVLVRNIDLLDTYNSFALKYFYLAFIIILPLYFAIFGLDKIYAEYFHLKNLDEPRREMQALDNLVKSQGILVQNARHRYLDLTRCIQDSSKVQR